MEFALIVAGALLLILAYFCIGVVAKFMLGWWIMVIGIPIALVVALAYGWIGAICGVLGFLALLGANNHWQGTALYEGLERKIDKAFYFSDT